MQSKRIMANIMSLALSSSVVSNNFADVNICLKAFAEDNQTVNVLMDNYDLWSEFALEKSGISSVGFLDIDFDNELEFIVANEAGSGIVTSLEFYKIKDNSILKLDVSDAWYGFPDDTITSDYSTRQLALYRDESGIMEYYGYNLIKDGVYFGESIFCSFAYHSSESVVSIKNYFSSVHKALYNSTTKEYDETNWWYDYTTESKISEEEYNMVGSFKLTELVNSLEPSSKRLLYSFKSGGDKTIRDKLYAK